MAIKKILIGEDDRGVAEIIENTLHTFGYETIHALDGESTCMAFVKQEPDLILLDILMPKMNGLEVCRWIRKRSYRNDIPIIVMSGVYRKKEQQEDAIKNYGANDYLIKPFRMDLLLERIKKFEKKGGSSDVLDNKEEEDILLESETEQFSYLGSISDRPIELLLNLLFSERETGKLVLRKNKLRIHLFFRNGSLIFAQTNIKKLTPAYALYEAKKLTKEQYLKVEQKVKADRVSREDAIRAFDLLSEDELKISLGLLYQDIVYMAFKWDQGDYYFVRNREPKFGSWQLLQSSANLIMGGLRRMPDLARIEKRLPSAEEYLHQNQNPLFKYQSVSFTSEEKVLFNLIDGTTRFSILLNNGELITTRAKSIFYGLIVSGLVEVKKTRMGEEEIEETYVTEEEVTPEHEEPSIEPEFAITSSGGNLLIEPLPQLFFNLFRGNFTGEASFEDMDEQKTIFFKNGKIVFASSTREEEKLGNILLDLKKINHKHFAKALRLQREQKNKKLGIQLMDMGLLTAEQLKLSLQLQIKKIVLNLFTWDRGSYMLQELPDIENNEISVSVSPPELILEALRQMTDAQKYERYLPHKSYPLQKAAKFHRYERYFDFTEGERQILRTIDSKKTLEDLINMFHIGRTNIYGFLFGMYTMKLVEMAPKRREKPVEAEAVVEEAEPVEEAAFDPFEPKPQEAIELNLDDEDNQEMPVFSAADEVVSADTEPLQQPPSSVDAPTETGPVELPQGDERDEMERIIDEREKTQAMLDEFYKVVQTGDYYRILGVEKTADVREIRMRFRTLAKKFHPDTIFNTGIQYSQDVLNEIFIKINEAHSVLTNPDSRERYDRERPEIKPGETEEELKIRADLTFQGGLKLLRRNQPLEAADLFREAIRLNPQKAIFHVHLADAYLEAQVPPRRVIRTALQAVLIDPDLPETHIVLSKVYLALNDGVKALQECEKVLELDPHNSYALNLKKELSGNSDQSEN